MHINCKIQRVCMNGLWDRQIKNGAWDLCELLPSRLSNCPLWECFLFSDKHTTWHRLVLSWVSSHPQCSPFVPGGVVNTVFCSFWGTCRANPAGRRNEAESLPHTACGRCCFYFLQHGVVFQDTTEPSERVQLMGTRPAPRSGVIFLTRPVGLISESGQLAASWRQLLAVQAVRGGSRRSVQSSLYTKGVGAHIWLQDALNSLLDKGAWSKEVRAGSVVLPRVKTIVKVNKRLSWLLVYPNKEREELLTQGFPLPFQGHRKVSAASNCCISLKGRMTKCGLGKYMVSFLKGCSAEMVEDGGHQEGEVQAEWGQCLTLYLEHFSVAFENGCKEKKKKRFKDFDIITLWSSVTSKVNVSNSAADYPWEKSVREIGGSLAWLFSGRNDLITEK